ncbi:MFS transporter [Streptomyces sp. NPDC059578]|uniref:MFS transporter n=1 Tax=Streptomyces sp. NPDC059578 TaxID=3346874 RepID=UPI00369D1883
MATAAPGRPTSPPPAAPADAPRSPLVSWLAVVSVALGIFVIVTTEILPIGLLTTIGADFTVSEGTAGLMMALPGILAAVSAPLVTAALGTTDRRPVLAAFVLLLAVANFLAAAAPSYWLVLLSRVLVGISIGGFWSVGAGLAARLVPAASVGRATAVIFSAVPLGSVLGVPLGTYVGSTAGWRTAFLTMALLTLAVLALLLLALPPLPPQRPANLSVLGDLLRTPATRYALAVTFLVVLAHFGAYTYVTPFLEQVPRLDPDLVTGCLLIYGAAGIAGTFLAGSTVSRAPRAAFGCAAALIAVATLALSVFGHWGMGAVALLIVWGVAYGAVPVCSQTWFARAAPGATEASSVLFTSSFQATIALGALAGGTVVDHASTSAVMAAGGATALVAVLVVGVGVRRVGVVG